MKKVVVVVDEEHKELFNGKNLKVINAYGTTTDISGFYSNPCLQIYEEKNLLAEFQEWKYWRATE